MSVPVAVDRAEIRAKWARAISTASPAVRPVADAIPEAMRTERRWVVWKYETRKTKPTKVPFRGDDTSVKAESDDPSTWCDFETAWASYQNDPNGIAGIGFMLGDGWFGVDLDDCLSDGTLHPDAQAIVDSNRSYTERSPGGNGLKVFGCDPSFALATGKRFNSSFGGNGHVEIYAGGRYFAVTGAHWPTSPATVEATGKAAAALVARLDAAKLAGKPKRTPPTLRNVDTGNIPMATRYDRCKKYVQECPDAISGQGGHNNTLRAAGETWRFDLDRASAIDLMRWFNATKTGSDPWDDDELLRKLDEAEKLCTASDRGIRLRESRPVGTAKTSSAPASIPDVIIGPDEHRVVSEVLEAMATDADIYCRGGELVQVIGGRGDERGIRRGDDVPTIRKVPAAHLRERITRSVRLLTISAEGEAKPAHPRDWLVNGLLHRGDYPGLRPLSAISSLPVLRSDGTIFQTAGWDEQTGVVYNPPADLAYPLIPDDIGLDDADAAATAILDPFCDFRLESEEHRSALLAQILTPMGRHAYDGPSPGFLDDANVRGSGKTIAATGCAIIATGTAPALLTYSADAVEQRKAITSILIAGDQVVIFDNITDVFGNDAIDRVLTGTRWKDRLLGKSENIGLPINTVFYATANNCQIEADTIRRIIHIRFDTMLEKPEERTGFKYPNFLAHVHANRYRLHAAGLTILSAYIRSGRPLAVLPAFGSFEGWSDLIRQAIVWVGLPDPCLTRAKLAEASDTTGDALGGLMLAWSDFDPSNVGYTISDVLHSLYKPGVDALHPLRVAIESFAGVAAGRLPTPRQFGNKLKGVRRRVLGDQFFEVDSGKNNKTGAVWKLMKPP